MRRRAKGGCLLTVLLLAGSAHAQGITNTAIRSAVEASVPSQWSLAWSVPSHLFTGGWSDPMEASQAELADAGGTTRASVLVLRTGCSPTNPIGVYPHDYRRCGSVHGRSLRSVASVPIGGGHYHLVHMVKHVLDEHEVSFIVVDQGSSYRVDSELFATAYGSACDGDVYNFQVWSDDPSTSTTLVGSVVAQLAAGAPLSHTNATPRTLPSATLDVVNYHDNRLHLALAGSAGASAAATVVAWTYPNPTPNVTVHPITFTATSEVAVLELPFEDRFATDFEIYLSVGGIGQDEVLASSNHFGHYASNWIPFAGPSSSVSLKGVDGAPPAPPRTNLGFTLNDSAIHLEGSLAAGSFIGAFVELLPELGATSLDFDAFDRLRFHARQPTAGALDTYELKLETSSGVHFLHLFQVGTTWQSHELTLANLVGTFGEPWTSGITVDRISLAAVAPANLPIQASLAFADLQVSRPPRLSLNVVGEGTVRVDPLGILTRGPTTLSIPRDVDITLVPVPDTRWLFERWYDDAGLVQPFRLSSDLSLVAAFKRKAALAPSPPTRGVER